MPRPGTANWRVGEDVRPEQRRIVVALVEREPRHRGAVFGERAQPLRDERGLAETGGRRDEDQLRVGRARRAARCNRGRATRLRRGDGMWSFVSISGFVISS